MKRLAVILCALGTVGCSANPPSMVEFSYSETVAPGGAEEACLEFGPADGSPPSRLSWSRQAKRGVVKISLEGTAPEGQLAGMIRSYASLLQTLNAPPAQKVSPASWMWPF